MAAAAAAAVAAAAVVAAAASSRVDREVVAGHTGGFLSNSHDVWMCVCPWPSVGHIGCLRPSSEAFAEEEEPLSSMAWRHSVGMRRGLPLRDVAVASAGN